MKNISVIGVGYVGLVTSTCFADLGNNVIALDINKERVANLKKGILPIYEPGLEEVVERNVEAGRLHFTSSYDEALRDAEFVFIAVGTPEKKDGGADLQYVESAVREIAKNMTRELIIINKSTVPVGTGDWVAETIKKYQSKDIPFSVVSCPEFLREGSAIADFTNPARTVLGSAKKSAAEKVAHLHLPLRAPIIITDLRTAEMIKYASNAFLATKISFINEVADICEALGADIKEVAVGMGYDPRIGKAFLDAGLGWGGSCFPKDVKALAYMAKQNQTHPQMLNSVMEINADRSNKVVDFLEDKLGDLSGKKIALLGLAFKPNTDDMREAVSIKLVDALSAKGAAVHGYDPVAQDVAAKLLPDLAIEKDAYSALDQANAVVIVTEWNEFKQLNLEKIKKLMISPVIFDGRNIYDPEQMARLGFAYKSIGR